jgi:hypothetical protein
VIGSANGSSDNEPNERLCVVMECESRATTFRPLIGYARLAVTVAAKPNGCMT